jgi:FkbM family methyltransferase
MRNPLETFSGQVLTWGRKIGPGRFVWRTFQRQIAKRVFRRDMKLSLANGRDVWLPRESAFSSVAWIMEGVVDDGSEMVLRMLHPVGRSFFDIGAHFGFYGVWMSDVADRVYAFEPDSRLHAALARNLRSAPGARLVPCAVSCESGHLEFIQAMSAPHSKIGGPKDALMPGKRIDVAAVRLDSFWVEEDRPHIGSMKVDTEGHEASVFRGARDSLAACRPLILVETDRAALEGYWDIFEPLGYRTGFLSEKVLGRPMRCDFGMPGDYHFENGMLFLVPPMTEEREFRAAVSLL